MLMQIWRKSSGKARATAVEWVRSRPWYTPLDPARPRPIPDPSASGFQTPPPFRPFIDVEPAAVQALIQSQSTAATAALSSSKPRKAAAAAVGAPAPQLPTPSASQAQPAGKAVAAGPATSGKGQAQKQQGGAVKQKAEGASKK